MNSPNIDDGHFEGLSSLVRLSGVSIPARARFVGETILSSSLSGLSVGLLSGTLGSTFLAASVGPLIPFLIGSGTGYIFGLFYQWNLSKRRALNYCENYPRLMAHSLRWEWEATDLPQTLSGKEMLVWVRQGGLPRLSVCILAAINCTGAVEEIQQRGRQNLVEFYADGGEET